MSDLPTGSKRPIISAKFLVLVIGLAALVFVGAFGSIFLKEFWDAAAASKKATALESSGARPTMPGVSGARPEPNQQTKEGDKEQQVEEKPAEENP